jgi:hypothetical protein
VIAETINGKLRSLEVKFDWTMPSNSSHKMAITAVADGPYWVTSLGGKRQHIQTNKPLVLVEALEDMAAAARQLYEQCMETTRLAMEKEEGGE